MGISTEEELPFRRKVAHVSILGTTQLHLRNPWIIAGWSAMFPGLGHLLLSKYLRGFLLFLWEMVFTTPLFGISRRQKGYWIKIGY